MRGDKKRGSGFRAQPLAQLPQLPGCGGVSRPRQRRALAEVVPAQVLDARLQGAVQRGLGSGLGVGEEEEGDGCQDEPPPEAGATRDICLS